jgi:hypothetical protein
MPDRQICTQDWSRAKQPLDVPIGGYARAFTRSPRIF